MSDLSLKTIGLGPTPSGVLSLNYIWETLGSAFRDRMQQGAVRDGMELWASTEVGTHPESWVRNRVTCTPSQPITEKLVL